MHFPLLITGDLHVTHRNLHLFKIFIDQVLSLKNSFDTLVVVGDIFDSQDTTKWEAILEVVNFFGDLYDDRKDIFLLSGTHDTLFLHHNRSTLEVFKRIASPLTARMKSFDCIWIPHSRDLDSDVNFLEDHLPARACFTHHMIKGLQIGTFVVPQGIPIELLKRCDWSFNGHIHQPQVQGNVVSVGSPWQHSFAEANQGKYLWLWDGQTVKPINSKVDPQFVVGDFEELKNVNLKGKSVRILLKQGEDIGYIAEFLEAVGALRWEFRSTSNQQSYKTTGADPCQLSDLIDRWASIKDLHPDETQLGKFLLGD